MAEEYRVHVDVLDKNNNIINQTRNNACEGGVRLSCFSDGEKWIRWVEIDKCPLNKKELRKWCIIMCRWGFKCYFSSKIMSISIPYSVLENGKFVSKSKIVKCYSITMLRKDYKDTNHFFIGSTLIKTAYYALDGYEYGKIIKSAFNMNIKADFMEKFLLAHYRNDYCTHRIGDHGVSIKLSLGRSIKLQKARSFKMLKGVNASFDIHSNVNYETVVDLVKEKKCQEAYDLFKAEEVEELKNKKKENFNE